MGDIHGPPLLLGFVLGTLLLWRDRRGYPGGPRSRRDRGLTALIEGFFGFVWFGWAQANASAGLRDWLAVAGVGAAVLAVAGQSDFIPVWVCAVVGVHFFPLASLLEDPLLVPLGASVATVALVALVAEPAGVAPSTVTGIGAGTLLTGFALAALAGVHTEEMPPLRSTDRPV